MRTAFKIIIAIILAVITVVLLVLVGDNWMKKIQTAKDNPDIEYVTKEPERITDDIVIKKVRAAVLKAYNVPDFSEILFEDKDNLLGNLQSIEPQNPGANDGKIVLHFTGMVSANTYSMQQAHDAAVSVMRTAGKEVPELQSVTAVTEVWDYRANKYGAVVASETATRDILDSYAD